MTISGCVSPLKSEGLKNKQKKEIIKNNYDDVQPWEGFRGWSPRAAYGKSSKNSTQRPEPEKEESKQK